MQKTDTKQMLLIHVPQKTNRVEYIFRHLLLTNAGLHIRITKSSENFINYTGPKFSYGPKAFPGILHFAAVSLLFETGIQIQDTHYFKTKGTAVFFPLKDAEASLPFDPFAAAFYFISRYEEYLPFTADTYHRFPPEQSLAYKHNLMEIPLVEVWLEKVLGVLKKHFPELEIKQPVYRFIPTVDVDMAWAYRHKGLLRTSGGFFRDILKNDRAALKNRICTLRQKQSDPYFTFDYLDNLEAKYGITHLYFLLLGKHGKYDKNTVPGHPAMQALAKRLHKRGPVGIHPSYASNFRQGRMEQEKQLLEQMISKPVTQSRQHYLVIRFPETLRSLNEAGIREDYSLGYTSAIGFRAGTCRPFPFYDLQRDEASQLICYPLNLMDAGLQYYLKLKPDEAIIKAGHLIESVKKYQGTLVSLFHNNSLSDTNEWKDWKKVYESILEAAI